MALRPGPTHTSYIGRIALSGSNPRPSMAGPAFAASFMTLTLVVSKRYQEVVLRFSNDEIDFIHDFGSMGSSPETRTFRFPVAFLALPAFVARLLSRALGVGNFEQVPSMILSYARPSRMLCVEARVEVVHERYIDAEDESNAERIRQLREGPVGFFNDGHINAEEERILIDRDFIVGEEEEEEVGVFSNGHITRVEEEEVIQSLRIPEEEALVEVSNDGYEEEEEVGVSNDGNIPESTREFLDGWIQTLESLPFDGEVEEEDDWIWIQPLWSPEEADLIEFLNSRHGDGEDTKERRSAIEKLKEKCGFYFHGKEELGTCSVCLEDLKGNVFRTTCSHLYHESCIESWFDRNKNSCPLCRAQLLFLAH